MEYGLLRRRVFDPSELHTLPGWSIFLSAFNRSERVNTVFAAVSAVSKEWLVHPEYDFAAADLPSNGTLRELTSRDESEFWDQYFRDSGADHWPADVSICIDSTGFMRPHLMVVLRLLRDRGFKRLDVLYSEPRAYESEDKTPFTQGAITEVRQVRGFEGVHGPDISDDDLLIIGAGYDDELIRRVADDKRSARKIEMFGLPSLQPHMYDENRLRAAAADEAVGPLPSRSHIFAPANDPFVTAQILHDRVTLEASRGLANLYLSPLGTKPQALGFAYFYLCEWSGRAASAIFPFAEYYSRETSVGFARVSLYEFELDWFAQT